MNTLLEPPSSFFQPVPCAGSNFVIKNALRFSSWLHYEISSVVLSALTVPKTHSVISKASSAYLL